MEDACECTRLRAETCAHSQLTAFPGTILVQGVLTLPSERLMHILCQRDIRRVQHVRRARLSAYVLYQQRPSSVQGCATSAQVCDQSTNGPMNLGLANQRTSGLIRLINWPADASTNHHLDRQPWVGPGVELPAADRAFQLKGDASLNSDIVIQHGTKVFINGRGSTITTGR